MNPVMAAWMPPIYEDLLDPANPGRPLPDAIAAVLPQPTRSFEHLERYTGADLVLLTPAARMHELARLTAAIASAEDAARIPEWLLRRVTDLNRIREAVAA